MRKSSVVAALLAIAATPAMAQDHAVGVRLGMLGLGVEYSYRINEFITVRGGVNGASYSFDETESGIDYEFDLDFDTLAVGVDIHPFRNRFRVSVGAMKNDNGLSASSTAGQDFDIGDETYTANEVGRLSGRIGFDSAAPYAGVGWDWMRDRKVGLALDLGLLSQGSPKVSFSASGPIASNPDFADDLAAEEAEVQEELDDFDLYPYAMLGVVFRF